MLAGIFYYNFKDNPAALNTYKLKYLLLGSAVYFIVMNGLTLMLPPDHLSYPSMWLAIYGSMLKSAWGIFPSIVLLHLALHNTPSILASVLKHPILRVAARLSYTIYLTQYGIIYAIYKHVTYPLTYGGFTILVFTAATVTITFSIALLLHLVIEAPFNIMLKNTLKKSSIKKS
uniref:Acyltransferase 3 domain-containing protein n=1 Tax=Anopheles atroparvus TaxID=41427 RepID=A0AAG5DDE0_ANOAO